MIRTWPFINTSVFIAFINRDSKLVVRFGDYCNQIILTCYFMDKKTVKPRKMACLCSCKKSIQTMASSNNFENITCLFIVNAD